MIRQAGEAYAPGGATDGPSRCRARDAGDAGDAGDIHDPICYVRNSQPQVTAKFDILPSGLASQVSKIRVKGSGGGLTFTAGDASVSGGIATLSSATSTTHLPNYVLWDNPLSIDWQASFTGDATWAGAGTSSNEAFITLNAPGNTWRTVLYLATKGGGTDVDSCVAATWAQFTARAVGSWEDGTGGYTRALHYYQDFYGLDVHNAHGLLTKFDGQCTAWADLLHTCLSANGIGDAILLRLEPPTLDYTLSEPPGVETPLDHFVVKNASFLDTTANPRWTEQQWTPADPYVWVSTDQNGHQAVGLPGQNTGTPAANYFIKHFIVEWGGNYYDPSYGSYASEIDLYTAGAIGGWGGQGQPTIPQDARVSRTGPDRGRLEYPTSGRPMR